jgi:hypothetical protein
VRVLAFAMSRILQNMTLARSGQQVPTDIIGVIKGPRQNWSAEHAEHEVAQCIEVLSRDVQRARTILQVTFPARASVWKRSVRLALLDREGSPSIPESGVTATSRVPNGLRVLREMLQGIEDKENEASHEEIDFEVSRVINLRRVQPKETDNRSASGEYIQISNVSVWDETGNGGLPNSYLHAGQEFHETNIPSDVLRADSDGELELEGRCGSDEQHSDHAFMLSQDITMVCSF